jgi:GTP-binding protein LepA
MIMEATIPQIRMRNFCIIAHIDHGKSTLADRMLELTATLQAREMREQVLDSMDLERERGITIKAHPVHMTHEFDGEMYAMNLIDTPGHVDFSYEVSRSLAACDGAVLLVDATQGIEAQTLANAYAATELDLPIIPVVNKIELPTARTDEVVKELAEFLGVAQSEVLRVSAKTGMGVRELLDRVVEVTPAPVGDPELELRALVFDSTYDPHLGVVAYVRVVDGSLTRGARIRLVQADTRAEAVDVGVFVPTRKQQESLKTGEVGFVATGLKDAHDWPVGDTVTMERAGNLDPLPGYRSPKPLVFAGLYATDPEAYPNLRDALARLRLSDPALSFQPEKSAALGFGFRSGFLGVLHMDIVRERLEREFGLELVITTPQVEYEVEYRDATVKVLDSPGEFPEPSMIAEIREPWMRLSVVTPTDYIGSVSELLSNRRGEHHNLEHLEPTRVLIEYDMPLAEMLSGFFDSLKSVSRGYASMDYGFLGYRAADLTKLDIRVNGQPVDALSTIVMRDRAAAIGRDLALRLKREIPRQLFEVAVQAVVGSRIVARESVRPLRKDVLAKCYGRDVSRKKKLIESQKKGKRRMKRVGQVDIPQEAFSAVLELSGAGARQK